MGQTDGDPPRFASDGVVGNNRPASYGRCVGAAASEMTTGEGSGRHGPDDSGPGRPG